MSEGTTIESITSTPAGTPVIKPVVIRTISPQLPQTSQDEAQQGQVINPAPTQKSTRGGKREGAGRPVGSKSISTEARRWIQERIDREKEELIEKMLELAKGQVYVYESITKEGKPNFYRMPPNPRIIQWLIEYLAGKPTQPIDPFGAGDNPAMEETRQLIRSFLDKEAQK